MQHLGQLAFYVAGIYTFFLSWGVLQERITTIAYAASATGTIEKFKYFLVLNLIQSLMCMLVAFVVLRSQGKSLGPTDRSILLQYGKVAISGVLASPFGYESLRHISYPTMILGKSCKLVPVMLMNFVVYRKRFEPHKYLTVALITAGVFGFMYFDQSGSGSGKHGGGAATSSLYGLVLLLINLLFDGLTNSWQDKIFIERRLTGQQMMFWMHTFCAALTLAYLLLNPLTHELSSALAFVRRHPVVSLDMLLFGACGALGQIFVFRMLEHFGSLALVTVTVTRKLFTILLSLFWFEHRMQPAQWLGVALVFGALVIEAFGGKGKRSSHSGSAGEKAEDKKIIKEKKKDDDYAVKTPIVKHMKSH